MTVEPWKVWEDYVNDELGLSPTAASGALWYEKGDGVDPSDSEWAYQVDAKYTDKNSRPVKYQEFTQLRRQALEHGKKFAMPIRVDPRNVKGPALDVVVITFEDFVALVAAAKEGER